MSRDVGQGLPVLFERNRDLECLTGGKSRGGSCHAHGAPDLRWLFVQSRRMENIALLVRRHRRLLRRRAELDSTFAIHKPLVASWRKANRIDEADAFRIVGTQCNN